MKHSAISLVLGLLIVLFVSVGVAKAQPYHTENSGTYVSQGTPIDINGDGLTADLYITSGKGSVFGPITNQTVAEWTFGAPTTCPAGTIVQGTLLSGTNVSRTMDGDLIYSVVDSGTLCFDGAVSKITATGNIAGGTGSFSGATGSLSFSATATPLYTDPVGHQFGSVTATTTGEIHMLTLM
jgi:hypothetical protein